MKRSISVLASCLAAVFLVAGEAHADPEGQPCVLEPTDELIEYGDLRTCSLNPLGELDIFRFVGAAGELVRIVATEGSDVGAEVCAELRSPGGVLLATDCHEVTATIELPLPDSGAYSILISEQNNNVVMNYRLVVKRLSPVSPASTILESGITLGGAMINPSGDIDLYTFQGTSGDVILIDGTEGSNGGPEVCIDLRRPDGSSVSGVVCHEVAARIEATLDQAGAHTVIVSENFSTDGSVAMNFTIQYTCLSGSCESLALQRCTLNLNQAAYVSGETVMLQNFHIVNPTSDTVDLKLWLGVPGFPPVTVIAGGLPAGFDQNFGTIFFQAIPPWFPLGTYGINCRMQSTVTGETLGLDLNSFEVQ